MHIDQRYYVLFNIRITTDFYIHHAHYSHVIEQRIVNRLSIVHKPAEPFLRPMVLSPI